MKPLWPHQQKAIELAREEMKRGNKWTCVVMPTGGGKSILAAAIGGNYVAKNPDKQLLAVAHREELVSQLYDTFTDCGLLCGAVQAKPTRPCNPHRPVQVASIQTLAARNIVLENVGMLIYDECFPAGTLVDGRPIEDYEPGDFVNAFDETTGKVVQRRVVRKFVNPAPRQLVRVNGIVCTPEHPFFTPSGYVAARDLRNTYVLYDLRRINRREAEDLQSSVQEQSEFANDVADQPESQSTGVPSQGDARCSKSDAQRCSPHENERNATDHEPSPQDSRGKWTASDSCASDASLTFSQCDNRVRSRNGQRRESSGTCESLQARSCVSGTEAGNRDRRWLARVSDQTDTGSEEGEFLRWTRVDSVEILERGCSRETGNMCPDGFVYNLEVEEFHNYFAEGVLVHNCHHSMSEQWSEIALNYKRRGALGIGLTATPIRADGLPLGDVFDALVQPTSVNELIDGGFLVPFTMAGPPRKLKKNQIAQSPVDAYLEHAQGRTAIVFATTRKVATTYSEEFNARGVRAGVVHANLPASERRSVLEAYKNGRLSVLVNVGILTEGFDHRPTSCVIVARPVGSLSLLLQMWGRGLRASPETGKTDAVLIDLHGSTHQDGFGPPDAEHEWTLDGDGERRKVLPQGPERFCPFCGCTILDPEATVCGDCGEERPGSIAPEVMNIPLVKYARKRKENSDQKIATLARWLAEAEKNGYKIGWALKRWEHVYGERVPADFIGAAKLRLRAP